MHAGCVHSVYNNEGRDGGYGDQAFSPGFRTNALRSTLLVHGEAVGRGGASDPDVSQTRADGGAICLAGGGIPVTPPRSIDQGTEVGCLAPQPEGDRHRGYSTPLHLALRANWRSGD